MSRDGRRARYPCLICKKRIRPGRKVLVIEQGMTTQWGYEREMEVDHPDLAHAYCFARSTRRYRRDKVEAGRRNGQRPA